LIQIQPTIELDEVIAAPIRVHLSNKIFNALFCSLFTRCAGKGRGEYFGIDIDRPEIGHISILWVLKMENDVFFLEISLLINRGRFIDEGLDHIVPCYPLRCYFGSLASSTALLRQDSSRGVLRKAVLHVLNLIIFSYPFSPSELPSIFLLTSLTMHKDSIIMIHCPTPAPWISARCYRPAQTLQAPPAHHHEPRRFPSLPIPLDLRPIRENLQA
jgi:hypothetical protein